MLLKTENDIENPKCENFSKYRLQEAPENFSTSINASLMPLLVLFSKESWIKNLHVS